jgi:putative ABC transport system permease protein
VRYLLLLPLTLARLVMTSIMLAMVQIRLNKMRSLLTTLGIVIGVASVAAVIAALTGLRANVLGEFETLGTNKIFIVPHINEYERRSWREARLRPEQFDGLMEHCPSVSQFTRLAMYSDQVSQRNKSATASIIGIEPAWHQIENRVVTAGRPFSIVDDRDARPVCLVTAQLCEKLDLPTDCIGRSIDLGARRFQIVGLVESRVESSMFGERGSRQEVLVPLRTLWNTYGNSMGCYGIATSRSPRVSEEAQAELRFFLRQSRHLSYYRPDDFELEVVEKYLQQFNRIAVAITLVAGGVVGISLLVGGVGIMNIMLVSVSERTREIGLRKAVGARPGEILLQFLIEAVMLSLLGGLVGLLLGHGLTRIMAAIPGAHLDKAAIPPWAVALSFGFAAGVGVVFGIVPAIKAARLDPIEALRHD